MKLTLLKAVQKALLATDGFQVNSYHDTSESLDVADIAEDLYYEMANDIRDWTHQSQLVVLESIGQHDRPNYLRMQDQLIRIQDSKLKYNVADCIESTVAMQPIQYLHPNEFLKCLCERDDKSDNALVVEDFNRSKYVIYTDCPPKYYTSFDDEHLVFDSFDASLDSTLQSNKVQCFATVIKGFIKEDDAVIPVPTHDVPTYLNMLKNRVSEYFHTEVLPSDARRARVQMINARLRSKRVGGLGKEHRRKNYGRR